MNQKMQAIERLVKIGFSFEEAYALWRDAKRLHTWAEHECNGTIERDDETGLVYSVWNTSGPGPIQRTRCADRETPARKRIEEIVKRHGLTVQFQGDPRGYVVRVVLGENHYDYVGIV